MRKNLLFASIMALSTFSYGQLITGRDLVKVSSIAQEKIPDLLSKQGFMQADRWTRSDTTIQHFQLTTKKAEELDDCFDRYAEVIACNNRYGFDYHTASYAEYARLVDDLKKDGFYTDGADEYNRYLYQKDDMTVEVSNQTEDTLTYYNLLVKKEVLPSPKNIQYAEDFLSFQSHANLEYVFG